MHSATLEGNIRRGCGYSIYNHDEAIVVSDRLNSALIANLQTWNESHGMELRYKFLHFLLTDVL